jgi:hypothetical protein
MSLQPATPHAAGPSRDLMLPLLLAPGLSPAAVATPKLLLP